MISILVLFSSCTHFVMFNHYHCNIDLVFHTLPAHMFVLLLPRLLDAVKVAGNHRNMPKVVDMADTCPSCKEIQDGYIKLKKICMSGKWITVNSFIDNYMCMYLVLVMYL